jgi:WD repeat-containing protein 23
VYDVELRKITLKLQGHRDDINAVCFADPLSTNVLFSGSDDSCVKVWDRRSMAGGREAGCLVGHMEGITYVASKGDGRYVVSNGKDQVLKLWDIRKMMERDNFDAMTRTDYSCGFDYRWMVNSPSTFSKYRIIQVQLYRVILMIVRWLRMPVIVC